MSTLVLATQNSSAAFEHPQVTPIYRTNDSDRHNSQPHRPIYFQTKLFYIFIVCSASILMSHVSYHHHHHQCIVHINRAICYYSFYYTFIPSSITTFLFTCNWFLENSLHTDQLERQFSVNIRDTFDLTNTVCANFIIFSLDSSNWLDDSSVVTSLAYTYTAYTYIVAIATVMV